MRFVWKAWEWIRVSGKHDLATIPIDVTFSLDALSATMSLVVTGVGFLIHLYSTKYMAKDEGYHRFFAYLNLFIFSMLVLILGNSLPILFVGWEGVGLCSYLLIGFWFDDERTPRRGRRRSSPIASVTSVCWSRWACSSITSARSTGTGIEGARRNLLAPVQLWPVGNQLPGTDFLAAEDPVDRRRHEVGQHARIT